MITTGRLSVNSVLPPQNFDIGKLTRIIESTGWAVRAERAYQMNTRSGWHSTVRVFWAGEFTTKKAAQRVFSEAFDNEVDIDFVKTSIAVYPKPVNTRDDLREACLYYASPIHDISDFVDKAMRIAGFWD